MKRFFALAAAALLSSIAFGQEPAPPPETTPPAETSPPPVDTTQPPASTTPSGAPASVESIFDALDADKNGTVGQQEAQAHPTVAQHFANADSNSDGSLSREEFLAKFRPQ